MGDRLSGDGVPGRRHAHPDGPVPGPRRVAADGGLEALLATAIRAGEVDPAGERRAVAAFSAARDAGALTARPRGRDDWRPGEGRRSRRSLKVTLSVAVAGLTLGGVAYAGMGAGGSGAHAGAHEGGATSSAGAGDGGTSGVSADGVAPSGSASPDHPDTIPDTAPDTAQDTEAQCRAYEQVEGRGKALDATAWRRLVDVAGGTANVEAYCADQLARAAQEKAARNPGAGQDRTAADPNSTANGNPNATPSANGNGNGDASGSGGAAGSGGANGSSGQKVTKAPARQ
jgi:hypothetical protein